MQLAPSGTDGAEAEALAALLASDRLARATYAATGVEDPGLVFAEANGNEVHVHALSQAFDRIVRRAPADHQPSRVVPAFRDVGGGQVESSRDEGPSSGSVDMSQVRALTTRSGLRRSGSYSVPFASATS